MIQPFSKPIYVTRPILPDLKSVVTHLRDVWDSQLLTNNGPKHQLLEAKLRDYLSVPALSLFNNGTSALLVALRALELSGEVITTPFTFAATAHSIAWNGLEPVFADIKNDDFTLDPRSIEKLITKKTTAILAVHVFGHPCDVHAIDEIARHYNLRVIYDAAHAFQTEIDGTPIGQFGDLTMFSFHATKLFHTAEGGALAMHEPEMKNKIDLIKNFGIKNEDEILFPGINGKLNEVQACVGLATLECVPKEREKRRRLWSAYAKALKNVPGVTFLEMPEKIQNSLQYLVIRINEKEFGISRNEVYSRFHDYNVFTRKYFFPLCSNFNCYRELPSAQKNKLPVANQVVNEVLSMPLYGSLTEEQVIKICSILVSFRAS